jgi:hypothetical protein
LIREMFPRFRAQAPASVRRGDLPQPRRFSGLQLQIHGGAEPSDLRRLRRPGRPNSAHRTQDLFQNLWVNCEESSPGQARTAFRFLKGKSDQEEHCLELGATSRLLEREPPLIASPAPLGRHERPVPKAARAKQARRKISSNCARVVALED